MPIFCLLVACGGESAEYLEREDLFEISLGVADNEIGNFFDTPSSGEKVFDIFMSDGRFYISDGGLQKLLVFNSYGDLVTLLYDPKKNPAYLGSYNLKDENTRSSRRTQPWSFNGIGNVAATSDSFFVEDRSSPENRVLDKRKILLDRRVLLFDHQKGYQGVIRQEGLSKGDPFAYIVDLLISGDALVVITRTKFRWMVFGFSLTGQLLYRVDVPVDLLPRREESIGRSLTKIVVGPDNKTLLLQLSFFFPGERESETFIYRVDIASGRYDPTPIQVPKEKVTIGEVKVPASFDLLGVTEGGLLILLAPVELKKSILLLLNDQGKVFQRRMLLTDDELTTWKQYHLNQTGPLTGLRLTWKGAALSWWRIDQIL